MRGRSQKIRIIHWTTAVGKRELHVISQRTFVRMFSISVIHLKKIPMNTTLAISRFNRSTKSCTRTRRFQAGGTLTIFSKQPRDQNRITENVVARLAISATPLSLLRVLERALLTSISSAISSSEVSLILCTFSPSHTENPSDCVVFKGQSRKRPMRRLRLRIASLTSVAGQTWLRPMSERHLQGRVFVSFPAMQRI